MLDKLVIHLKNIIFFKLVMYLICIILFIALIPKFQNQLTKSLVRKAKSEILLNKSITQLESITQFEKNIYDSNLKYNDLVANSNQKSCDTRMELLKNLNLVSQKYLLHELIKAKITRIFEIASIKNKNGEVKLHQYEVVINFAVNTSNDVLNLIDEINSFLPKGSNIVSTQIKILRVLTPATIKELSTSGSPSLIDVSIKVLLREIMYEK